MQPSIQIDASIWNAQALALSVALGKDGPEVMKDEARLLLKQVIGFTPPRNKSQGEGAIAADLLGGRKLRDGNRSVGIIQPIKPFMTPPESGVDRPQWISKDGTLYGVENHYWKPEAGYGDIRPLHKASKTKRGRVSTAGSYRQVGRWKWVDRIFTTYENAGAYVKEIQKRVGNLKAGWAVAYMNLGGKTRKWISRHVNSGRAKGTGGRLQGSKEMPWIEIGNYAYGVREMGRIVNNALKARSSAMARRIKLVMSGYSADMARGMRAQSRARRTMGSEVAS